MANNNIVRGTTPTLIFTLPFDASNVEKAYITIAQYGKIVIDKEVGTEGCACSDDVIVLHLTQEDTLKLKDCCKAEIQIRLRTIKGEAIAFDILETFVKKIIKDGVI